MKEKLNVLDFEINEFTDVKEPEPSIYVGGSTFSARGEISFISGKAKAGKTSLASVMLAGCLTENNDFDTLGTNGVYCEGLQSLKTLSIIFLELILDCSVST